MTLAPELVPMSDKATQIEIINTQHLADGTMIELARIECQHEKVDTLFDGNSPTINYEILDVEGDQQCVYHHFQPDKNNVVHWLISILDERQLMIVYPMRFDRETGASVTLMGTTDTIQEAYQQFPPEIERYITIDQVSESMPALGGLRSLLTERQRKVLDVATDLGYYSIPRRATASDVAEVVGCAPSTVSEHLRKIDARVLSRLAK